jgi:catechol 2,3-dioxygenase-like lactoylglutathione lyase family enzyme
MQGHVGVKRIYWKRAAILLAVGSLLQFAWADAREQTGAQHAAPLRGAQDAPKRPRITGIDRVRLYATDLDKSRDFYSKLIGVRAGGFLCSDTPHPCFTVGYRFQSLELEKAPGAGTKNWISCIVFATDDVSQMRRYLVARGVTASEIHKDSYDKHTYAAHFDVRDPEGNPISFIQRFSIAVDDFRPHVPILHTGFVVKDIAAENRFYVDVLGFKLYWQGGMKDDGVDWYELQVPDGENWIEYMLNVPATADHKQLGAQNHFSFGVKEIQAAGEQLRKNGIEKVAGPGIGRDGKRGLNVYDPDDTRVEVTEFTPAREPCCHPYTAPHPKP